MTYTTTVPADNSSLANFVAWGKAISTAFSTLGWVQTNDTGQVDWATIASVPSGTYVYEIWKANDAEAADLPIVVKVGYGFSGTQPAVTAIIGLASDGSGSITGTTIFNSTPGQGLGLCSNGVGSNQGDTLYHCYFSGDAGEFRMLMWQDSPSAMPTFFAIERSKDASGAKTAEYITGLKTNGFQGTGIIAQQTLLAAPLATTRERGFITCNVTSASATGAFNGSVAAFPIFPLIGKLGNPILGAMVAAWGDVANGTQVTVSTLYGSTHNFLACKTLNDSAMGNLGKYVDSGNDSALLMRYE